MNTGRIWRHLTASQWRLRRAFSRDALARIEQAIAASETQHRGQICFAVEGALDASPLFKGQSARDRAVDVFSRLRVWDTEGNNGVLIYLLLADRDVEVVADRGIDAKVDAREWAGICREMESAFRRGNYAEGVISGIEAVTRHLRKHFPADGANRNELPDRPAVI